MFQAALHETVLSRLDKDVYNKYAVEEQAASVGIEDKVVLVAFHILVPLLCHPAVLNFFAAAMDALPCSDNSLHRQVRRSPCRNCYADVVIIIVVTT